MVHRKRLVTPCFRYTKLRRVDEGKTRERAHDDEFRSGILIPGIWTNPRPFIPANGGGGEAFRSLANVLIYEMYLFLYFERLLDNWLLAND